MGLIDFSVVVEHAGEVGASLLPTVAAGEMK